MRFILILFLIFFSGCTLVEQAPSPQVYKSTGAPKEALDIKEKLHIEPESTAEVKPTIFLNGYIKGVIEALYWDKKSELWYYEVTGSDTSNGKLPNASFTHNVKEFEEGALIYAQIKDGKLLEIYKIGEGKILNPKKIIPKQILTKKIEVLKRRTKTRQKITPPESQSIVLE